MNTRFKFVCTEITRRPVIEQADKYVYTARFKAVWDNTPENKAFADKTPEGLLSLGTYEQGVFIVGKEYYFDATMAEGEV